MNLKRKCFICIIVSILILSYSTTCFAQKEADLREVKLDGVEESNIEPRVNMWTFIDTTSGSIPVPVGTYVPGASSYYIRLLQASLNILGYNCGTADGIYGNNTKNAITSFQKNNGITVDGIAGEYTWGNIGHLIRSEGLTVSF